MRYATLNPGLGGGGCSHVLVSQCSYHCTWKPSSGFHSQVMGHDFWVVTPCIRSVTDSPSGTPDDMEGTRLTIVAHEPDGFEFTIRTPGTPARWIQYEEELEAVWSRVEVLGRRLRRLGRLRREKNSAASVAGAAAKGRPLFSGAADDKADTYDPATADSLDAQSLEEQVRPSWLCTCALLGCTRTYFLLLVAPDSRVRVPYYCGSTNSLVDSCRILPPSHSPPPDDISTIKHCTPQPSASSRFSSTGLISVHSQEGQRPVGTL
jgi:hypothetical protein